MSFWPSVYDRIRRGEKNIEFRRVFPKENRFAYMYVTKPVKAIKGIIYFGEKHTLSELKVIYKNDPNMLAQIENNPGSYRFGVDIIGFKEIEAITLEELRRNVPDFVAPQSYLLLENNPLLADFIKKRG
jgi:hypothetical protein